MNHSRLLEQLLAEEWGKGLRLTTIPQVMNRLDMVDDPRMRRRVGHRLTEWWQGALASPEKRQEVVAAIGRDVDEVLDEHWRQQIVTWHPASVILSENEKLVARHILLSEGTGLPLPQPRETATVLGLPIQEVYKALRMLAHLSFLEMPDKRSPATYALAQDYEHFLEGLGFSFHTVTLDEGDVFGVP